MACHPNRSAQLLSRQPAFCPGTIGLCTTGYRRRARIVGTEVRTARFALENINKVESAGSASTQAVRAASMCPLTDRPRPVNKYAARLLYLKHKPEAPPEATETAGASVSRIWNDGCGASRKRWWRGYGRPVGVGSNAMENPSRSRGDGGWGFHLRDGYATKTLTLRAIPATLSIWL
jgi:hypothetical protein